MKNYIKNFIKTHSPCFFLIYRIRFLIKKHINWEILRAKCRLLIANNHYYKPQEWQYKNIEPAFIVEKMLICSDGRLQNDYMFHFINGKFQFVHCNVKGDKNNTYKIVYNTNGNPLPFSWENIKTDGKYERGIEISKPWSFEKMTEIGTWITQNFKYVRVDFYDVDRNSFYGEITICHGSGLNNFIPNQYDFVFGKNLTLVI